MKGKKGLIIWLVLILLLMVLGFLSFVFFRNLKYDDKEDYVAVLDAWLMYLIKGEHIRTDFVPNDVDENELVEKIKKYY